MGSTHVETGGIHSVVIAYPIRSIDRWMDGCWPCHDEQISRVSCHTGGFPRDAKHPLLADIRIFFTRYLNVIHLYWTCKESFRAFFHPLFVWLAFFIGTPPRTYVSRVRGSGRAQAVQVTFAQNRALRKRPEATHHACILL